MSYDELENKLKQIGITRDMKIRMSIADIQKVEGKGLAITINMNDGEITLFNFDEEREFPLIDLIFTAMKEEER